MKERPILFSGPMVRALLAGTKTQTRRIAKDVKHPGWGNVYTPGALAREPQHTIDLACPYGRLGDLLWVRETHGFGGDAYAPDVHYRATHPDAPIQGRWLPSIHMRRIDSRITLEITGVRVERLQDIREADALAEGLRTWASEQDTPVKDMPEGETRLVFRQLWEEINGPDSWAASPWVWVIDFKRIEQPQTAH